jgi:hypothetical protein
MSSGEVAGMARSYGGGEMVAGMAPYGEQTSRLAEHATQRINHRPQDGFDGIGGRSDCAADLLADGTSHPAEGSAENMEEVHDVDSCGD